MINNKINAKLINTTNTAFKIYINEKGFLEFNKTKTMIYFYTHSLREFTFRTTDILEYTRTDNKLEVKTLNSIYIFEVDESVTNPELAILTHCQKSIIEYMKNVKSNCFVCSSYDSSINSKVISYVIFENEITRCEAMQKLDNKSLVDMQDNLVTNIYQAGSLDNKILDFKIYDNDCIYFDDISDNELKKCLKLFLNGRNYIKENNKIFVHVSDFREFLNS